MTKKEKITLLDYFKMRLFVFQPKNLITIFAT